MGEPGVIVRHATADVLKLVPNKTKGELSFWGHPTRMPSNLNAKREKVRRRREKIGFVPVTSSPY
jgi:hypothetical protein